MSRYRAEEHWYIGETNEPTIDKETVVRAAVIHCQRTEIPQMIHDHSRGEKCTIECVTIEKQKGILVPAVVNEAEPQAVVPRYSRGRGRHSFDGTRGNRYG